MITGSIEGRKEIPQIQENGLAPEILEAIQIASANVPHSYVDWQWEADTRTKLTHLSGVWENKTTTSIIRSMVAGTSLEAIAAETLMNFCVMRSLTFSHKNGARGIITSPIQDFTQHMGMSEAEQILLHLGYTHEPDQKLREARAKKGEPVITQNNLKSFRFGKDSSVDIAPLGLGHGFVGPWARKQEQPIHNFVTNGLVSEHPLIYDFALSDRHSIWTTEPLRLSAYVAELLEGPQPVVIHPVR